MELHKYTIADWMVILWRVNIAALILAMIGGIVGGIVTFMFYAVFVA